MTTDVARKNLGQKHPEHPRGEEDARSGALDPLGAERHKVGEGILNLLDAFVFHPGSATARSSSVVHDIVSP